MFEKVPGGLHEKLMSSKVLEEVCGKLILEKIPGQLREKINVVKSGCGGAWKINDGKKWLHCGDLISIQ